MNPNRWRWHKLYQKDGFASLVRMQITVCGTETKMQQGECIKRHTWPTSLWLSMLKQLFPKINATLRKQKQKQKKWPL